MKAWTTLPITLATQLALFAPAWADVEPDPSDPAGPYSMVALVLVLVAAGIYLYRRRRK